MSDAIKSKGVFVLAGMTVCVVAVSLIVWQLADAPNSAEMIERSAVDGSNPETPADAVLDEATQKYIWDLEHITFELEQRLLPQLADALEQRTPDSLNRFLSDGFTASVLAAPGAAISHGPVRQVQLTDQSSDRLTVNGEQFAAHLVDQLAPFRRIAGVRFRVLNIAAKDRQPDSGQWSLKLLLSVSGRSASDEILTLELTADVPARFVTDEDIMAGQIFTGWKTAQATLVASPPLLREVTAQTGLARLPLHDNWSPDCRNPRQYSAQIACGDWSLDGRPDLVVATLAGEQWLLQQTETGQFIDTTADVGLPRKIQMYGRQCVATLFDFDNDGDDDLLLGATLYRNDHGHRFLEVRNSGLRLGFDPMGAVVADYDCDGLLDLYVLYQHSPDNEFTGTRGWINDDRSGAPNELWRNLGNGRFQNVTDRAGVAGGHRHSFAAAWYFANDDHYPDLYVANDFARNSVFLNRGNGTFEDISDESRAADFATSMGVAVGDLDNDARTEIYVANMFSKMGRRIIAQVSESDYPAGVYEQLKGSCAGNRLYRPLRSSADGTPVYEEVSDPLGINGVGWAYAPALVDLDLDGFLDIYATAGFLSFDRGKPDG